MSPCMQCDELERCERCRELVELRSKLDKVERDNVRLKALNDVLHDDDVTAQWNRAVGAEAERDFLRNSTDSLTERLNEAEAKLASQEKHADSVSRILDNLEAAAVAINPYPVGYRPSAYEAATQLPEDLKEAKAKLAAVREAGQAMHDELGKLFIGTPGQKLFRAAIADAGKEPANE